MPLLRYIYTLIVFILTPFFVARLLLKSIKQPAYRQRIGERFARYQQAVQKVDVCLHAVSYGEVEVARKLIDACLDARMTLCVTTTTPTGSSRVRSLYGDKVMHVYLPYELPFVLKRFFRCFIPNCLIIMETEIWPNLYSAAFQNNIPVVISNARLSARSVDGYRKIAGFLRPILLQTRLILTQTRRDKEHFCTLGANPKNVLVTGNMKFDISFDERIYRQGAAFKQGLKGRRVLLAASTHPGEEEIILKVLQTLRKRYNDLLLILAPRHPERTPDIIRAVSEHGFKENIKSLCAYPDPACDVYVVDTLGDLKTFYYVSDIAFIGGSLVPHGGHNMLEAVLAEVPVVTGEHVFNFREIVVKLSEVDGLLIVKTVQALIDACHLLFEDKEKVEKMINAAKQVLLKNQGAFKTQWKAIKPLGIK